MSTIEAETPFRIGELARRAGVTPRAVRYYEQLGLLSPHGRADGAHRMYDEQDEARLREVLRVRDLLGLSLADLGEWMAAEDARAGLRARWNADPAPDPGDRDQILREALAHLERQLGLVAARRTALEVLEDELTAKRRRMRELLVQPEGAAS
jgi:MerR family transcriptional regulator, repressor of the yfmOP operon